MQSYQNLIYAKLQGNNPKSKYDNLILMQDIILSVYQNFKKEMPEIISVIDTHFNIKDLSK
jgi:hypothetical protein